MNQLRFYRWRRPREMCMALGISNLVEPDRAIMALKVPQDYFAPGASVAAHQDVAALLHFRKTTQEMGEYLVKFDLPLRQAGGRTEPGGTSLQALGASLCLQNAGRPRHEKPLISASRHGHLEISVISRQMRRLFGPMGSVGKQDVLFVGGDSKDGSLPAAASSLSCARFTVKPGGSCRVNGRER